MSELAQWWRDKAEAEIEATVGKAIEYGARDLIEMGRTLGFLMGRTLNDQEAAELGCVQYLVGKLARVNSAWADGRAPSDDTYLDIGIYVRMIQRIRAVGGWPGIPRDEGSGGYGATGATSGHSGPIPPARVQGEPGRIAYLAHPIDFFNKDDESLLPEMLGTATEALLSAGYAIYDPAEAWQLAGDEGIGVVHWANLAMLEHASLLVIVMPPDTMSIGTIAEGVAAPCPVIFYNSEPIVSVVGQALGWTMVSDPADLERLIKES